MGSRAQAKCISQRSQAWVGGGAREDKASTILKPFAEQYRTSGNGTTAALRLQCFPRIAVTRMYTLHNPPHGLSAWRVSSRSLAQCNFKLIMHRAAPGAQSDVE